MVNKETNIRSLLREILGLIGVIGKLLISYMEDFMTYVIGIGIGDVILYDKGNVEQNDIEEEDVINTQLRSVNNISGIDEHNKPIYDGSYERFSED